MFLRYVYKYRPINYKVIEFKRFPYIKVVLWSYLLSYLLSLGIENRGDNIVSRRGRSYKNNVFPSTYILPYIHMYLRTYTYTHIHTHTYLHIYTYTYTHTYLHLHIYNIYTTYYFYIYL